MLTTEQRATKGAMWLAHWQGWQSLGVPMAEYARREEFDVDAAYRGKRILRRTGQWVGVAAAPAAKSKRGNAPVRFARVSVSDAPRPASPRCFYVVDPPPPLTNGRLGARRNPNFSSGVDGAPVLTL